MRARSQEAVSVCCILASVVPSRQDKSDSPFCTAPGEEVLTAGPGESFGEVAIFPDICRYRYETATVATPVLKAYMLARESFHELELLHPAFCLKMRCG